MDGRGYRLQTRGDKLGVAWCCMARTTCRHQRAIRVRVRVGVGVRVRVRVSVRVGVRVRAGRARARARVRVRIRVRATCGQDSAIRVRGTGRIAG